PATSSGPASAASTPSGTGVAGACAGSRPSRRSRPRTTLTASTAIGTTWPSGSRAARERRRHDVERRGAAGGRARLAAAAGVARRGAPEVGGRRHAGGRVQEDRGPRGGRGDQAPGGRGARRGHG